MNVVVALDRGSLVAMGVSIGLMLQPWWDAGMVVGFWCVIISTIAQIIFSHLPHVPQAVPQAPSPKPQASSDQREEAP